MNSSADNKTRITVPEFAKRIFKEQPLRFSVIVLALAISGLLEGLGIALFVPLLEMVNAKSPSQQLYANNSAFTRFLNTLLNFFGAQLNLESILITIFIIVLIQQSIFLFQQFIFIKSLHLFEYTLRENLYTSIFKSNWSFFLKSKTGSLTNALTNEAIRTGVAYYNLFHLISYCVIIAIYLTIALTISWPLTVAAFLLGLSSSIFIRNIINKASLYGSNISEQNDILQNEASEQISGAKLVKGYSAEESTTRRFSEYLKKLFKFRFQQEFNVVSIRSFFELSMAGLLCLGIFFAIRFLKLNIAMLLVFLFIFYRLAPRISNSQTSLHELVANLPAVQLIDQHVNSALSMEEKGGNKVFSGSFNEIRFDNLGFSYEPSRKILKSINLVIPQTKTIAIVGSSGAGKSSIIDLLMGLLTPDEGNIYLDDTPLNQFNIKSWRSNIGYVAQDTVLFHDSVKKNISWAYPNASEKEIDAAAKLSYAYDFVKQLPEGYDTIIGERGTRLSGGQRQRIALARAILRKPKLLVLDEATSALDAESEQKIQKAVERLANSITVIIVTHRLSTVKNADYIYVLENGNIVEEGTWRELLLNKKRFFKLKQLQELESKATKHQE